MNASAESKTKKMAILAKAEELFANFGLHGVSVRDIADAAGVPPTLVLYHFSSKDRLYSAVFEHRAEALTQAREAGLRRFGTAARPDVREVLEGMARPWLDLRSVPGGLAYARLVAREVSDPSEESRGIIAMTLDPTARRFLKAIERALPWVEKGRVHLAFHCFTASLVSVMANTGRIQRLSASALPGGFAASEDKIVDFFAAAFAALPKRKRSKRRAAR